MEGCKSVGQFSPIKELAEKFSRRFKQKQPFSNYQVIPGKSEFMSFHYFLFFVLPWIFGQTGKQNHCPHGFFHSVAHRLRKIRASKGRESFIFSNTFSPSPILCQKLPGDCNFYIHFLTGIYLFQMRTAIKQSIYTQLCKPGF